MRRPEFRTTRTRKVCHWINGVLDQWFIRYFLLPLLYAVPVAVLAHLLGDADLTKKLTIFASPYLAERVVKLQIPLMVIFLVCVSLISGLRSAIRHFAAPNSELGRDELVALFDSLNEVVVAKAKLLLKKTPDALKNGWKHTRLNREISEPAQQIALLVYAVRGFFEFMSNNHVSFRTGLMAIKDKKPYEWFAFAPQEHPPRTAPETLSAPTSAIMRAIQSGKMIVISDVQKELHKKSKNDRRCVRGSMEDHDNGALLAYPIYCANTKEPIYVLTILGDKAQCLQESELERYLWILEHFGTRIILEHHHMIMLEAAG